MIAERSIAYCGLACCLCAKDCPGCTSGGCQDKDWCKNYTCCREKGYEGCWQCPDFPCAGSMLDKVKPRAFARFVQRHGKQALLDALARNEAAGICYHDGPGSITGDYDRAGSEAAILAMLAGEASLPDEKEKTCP